MANALKMAIIEAIQSLRSAGLSSREIARRLGVHRETVSRHLRQGPEAVLKPANAPVVGPNGRRRKTHVLRVVLSHSRKTYSEAVFTQSTDDFLQCIENAFEHFGGVPRALVVDNLKAAVLQADWFDPEINPKFADFCRHYGTVVLPTKPRTPRHKGKTERGVAYVQDSALKGRTFQNLAEQNEYLESWEDRIADRRIHGTTKRQVLAVLQDSERQTLLSLPTTRFENFREVKRMVSRDGNVEVDKAFYMKEIAIHAKHDHGRFSTTMHHVHPMKINGLERGISYLLGKVRSVPCDSSSDDGPRSRSRSSF